MMNTIEIMVTMGILESVSSGSDGVWRVVNSVGSLRWGLANAVSGSEVSLWGFWIILLVWLFTADTLALWLSQTVGRIVSVSIQRPLDSLSYCLM